MFPLAYQPRRRIEMACEHRLARIFARPTRTNVGRRQRLSGGKAYLVEHAQGLLGHDIGRDQTGRGLVSASLLYF